MPSILLTNYYTPPLLSIVRKSLPAGFDLIPLDEPTREDVLRKAPNADYFLVGGRLKIDDEIVDSASKLKMVQRTGVGLDSLDLSSLKRRNIPLYLNRGVNARSVAEHTIMLILAVIRRLTLVDGAIKSGKWAKHELGIQNHDLFGKTVGLIGLGNIGAYVAQMLRPFGVRLIYNKRNRLPREEELGLDIEYRSFQALLKESDIVSLHCPLTGNTEKFISWQELSILKKGAILINTSRGKLIDEEAMLQFLKLGKLKGAGLDVFEQEPIDTSNDILKLSNVILTPHISGVTYESFRSMMIEAFSNISQFDKGDLKTIENRKVIYDLK